MLTCLMMQIFSGGHSMSESVCMVKHCTKRTQGARKCKECDVLMLDFALPLKDILFCL